MRNPRGGKREKDEFDQLAQHQKLLRERAWIQSQVSVTFELVLLTPLGVMLLPHKVFLLDII